AHWAKLQAAMVEALAMTAGPKTDENVNDEALAASEMTVASLSLSDFAPGPRLRILVAEDNVVNQLFAVRTLERAGHEAIVAENGIAALALLERFHFDVVLMDVQMPVMDGYQATARIRESERGTDRHQRIIATTAHAMK